jgi:hypothetical protein
MSTLTQALLYNNWHFSCELMTLRLDFKIVKSQQQKDMALISAHNTKRTVMY